MRTQLVDLEVELRAVRAETPPLRLGDFIASLGPWEGESMEELTRRLRIAREA